jgi:murein DD-endopeptidase MepM/ murein hydrolase activator NlpD
MPLSLVHFPVQVPRGFDFDHAPEIRRPNGEGFCVKQITFSDEFDGTRPGGKHEAIDIFGAIGLWIVATTNGKVVETWRYHEQELPGAGFSPRGGNYVRIIDLQGNVHYYAHMLNPSFAKSGAMVFAGAILGFLGNSGACGCPHLHYQVRGPYPLNPGGGGQGINPYNELKRLHPQLR